MKKVVCIGSAGKDIFFPTNEGVIIETPEDIMSQKKIAFEMGAKYNIENRYESLGGCAANVACGLKRLGINAECYSIVGDDMVGDWVRAELEKEKINLKLIEVLENSKTDLSAIIVDSRSGDRTIFSNRRANSRFMIEDTKKISHAEWILIGDLSDTWKDNMDIILEVAKKNDIRLAINPREKAIHENVKKVIAVIQECNILILNKDEAIEIVLGNDEQAGSQDLNDEKFLIQELKELGPDVVALTDGKNGAWAFDGEEIVHAKAKGISPIDTTGAGDAFTSGFLAAYLKGSNLVESIKWATANSGHSVEYYGGIEGLLRHDEMLEHAMEIEVNK